MNCPNCPNVVLGVLGHLKALPVVGLSVFVLLSYTSIYNYINNTTNKNYYNQKYKDTRTILCNLWYIKDSTVLKEKDSLKTKRGQESHAVPLEDIFGSLTLIGNITNDKEKINER